MKKIDIPSSLEKVNTILANMHIAEQAHTLTFLRKGRVEWVTGLQYAYWHELFSFLLELTES